MKARPYQPHLATVINWQFDGASLTFGLEEVIGIPGAAFKLCDGEGLKGTGATLPLWRVPNPAWMTYICDEYTGSGNPVGAPVKISGDNSPDDLNAIAGDIWVGYLSDNEVFKFK